MNVAYYSLIALLALSVPTLAYQAPVAADSPPSSAAKASEDNQIHLDVFVSDKSYKPAAGLKQQDFTVLDNKHPQPITSFQASESPSSAEPVQVILLVDTVNASYPTVTYERNDIKRFLRQNNGQLPQPVTIVFFSDNGAEVINSPSRDGNALSATLDRYETNIRTIRRSAGFFGDEERIQLSLSTLDALAAREQSVPGRKLVLWISPGWPYMNGPRPNRFTKEEQNLFQSVVQISNSLRRARITLYSIAPLERMNREDSFDSLERENEYGMFLKGVSSAREVQSGNLALQVLATQSGGKVFHGNSDIAAVIQTATADAGTFYTLTIDAPPAGHPDEYHSLTVKVDKPGLIARTRTGYYSQH